jgi:hypothetical protein
LIVIGAILTFGIHHMDLGPLDLSTIGWILMAAGLFMLILTLYVWNSRRARVVERPVQRTVAPPPAAGTGVPPAPGDPYVEERYEQRRTY